MAYHFHIRTDDIEITGRVCPSLDPHDAMAEHCSVTFHDIPTNMHQDIHVANEVEMMELLRIWLTVSDNGDEDDIKAQNTLRQKYLLSGKFLP